MHYESATLGSGSVEYGLAGATTGFRATGCSDGTMIAMESDSELNGVTLDANNICTSGLRINTAGTRYVANSHLKDSTGQGLHAQGDDAEFRIDHSRFTGSNGSGVQAQAGGTIFISNSYVAGNGGEGLRAQATGATIIADHMVIENNVGRGIGAFNGGSFVQITDSVVRNNRSGFIAGLGTTIYADRVLVTENRDVGAFATGGKITINNSIISHNGFGVPDEGDDPATTTDVLPGGLAADTFSTDPVAGTIDAHNVLIIGNNRGVQSKGAGVGGIQSTVTITGNSTLSENTRGDFFNNFECSTTSPFGGAFQTGTIRVNGDEVPLSTPIYAQCH